VITSELGGDVDGFAEFDTVPLAAASIGRSIAPSSMTSATWRSGAAAGRGRRWSSTSRSSRVSSNGGQTHRMGPRSQRRCSRR
jgi:hypothetical protein